MSIFHLKWRHPDLWTKQVGKAVVTITTKYVGLTGLL
jgi:hypothetical protein